MQPLYLFVQGMRPLKTNAPTAISFSVADQIVIAGDSGADRATVRQAIAYALYGQASSRVRADRELMDEESSCLRVTLVFWTHSNAWEVTRTMARLSNGGVGNTSCTLRRIGDVSPTVTRIDGARRVNRRLGELLQGDNDGVQPWLHPRARRPPPRRNANDGDAHDDVAAVGVDVDLLANAWRPSAASRPFCGEKRRRSPRLPPQAAPWPARSIGGRRPYSSSAPRRCARRRRDTPRQSSAGMPSALGTVSMAFEDVSTQQREPRLAGPPRPHPRSN